ncbi:unnamed protein product [Echinostoma caproni]|uniref:Nucleoporin Nup37 n=1 Tax=Echinostoma caproni TaxID=27848 RepID=A0A183A3E5_9TREM|nr:unnamed protein product [Echinostoma caproni]
MSHSFEALEGQYQYYNCFVSQCKESQTNNISVRLSFLENAPSYDSNPHFAMEIAGESSYGSQDWRSESMYCYNIGREIITFLQENHNNPADRRTFKVSPTYHVFKPVNDDPRPILLVGLLNGEIQLISPVQKDILKIFNEEVCIFQNNFIFQSLQKSIDKTPVTCISWVPGSPNQFLATHSSGHMYLYDEKLPPNATPPTYELFKEGSGFSVYTCKAKSTRNPLYRWIFGTRSGAASSSNSLVHQSDSIRINKLSPQLDNGFHPKLAVAELRNDLLGSNMSQTNLYSVNDDTASVNQIAFSPCGKYLALVTEDGYLRVLEYHTMELYVSLRPNISFTQVKHFYRLSSLIFKIS